MVIGPVYGAAVVVQTTLVALPAVVTLFAAVVEVAFPVPLPLLASTHMTTIFNIPQF